MSLLNWISKILCILLLTFAACSTDWLEPKKIQFLDANSGTLKAEYSLDIAFQFERQEKGLMFKKTYPKDQGMIFFFPPFSRVGFWMKNTFIDLDLIFIDDEGKIVDFHRGAKAHDETGIGSYYPYMYCLEVNAGQVEDKALLPGDQVKFLY